MDLMFGAKILLKDAESVKKVLKKQIDFSYKPKKTSTHFIVPLIDKGSEIGYQLVEDEFEKNVDPKINIGSFDVVGDIAIVEIKDQDESILGKDILRFHKNIKTVLKKTGHHDGEFRTQKLECIAGVDKRKTLYKESGVRLLIDVENVYFSQRLSTERKRIFQQINDGEKILVMFSGCGVYPLVIAKNTDAALIIGVEKNPIAHDYAVKNKELNKAKNVEFICGDVRDIVPTLKTNFDRIIMPLPKSAENFLFLLEEMKELIVHFYDFEHENELKLGEEKVKNVFPNVDIIGIHLCGQYAPGKFRICVDFKK